MGLITNNETKCMKEGNRYGDFVCFPYIHFHSNVSGAIYNAVMRKCSCLGGSSASRGKLEVEYVSIPQCLLQNLPINSLLPSPLKKTLEIPTKRRYILRWVQSA